MGQMSRTCPWDAGRGTVSGSRHSNTGFLEVSFEWEKGRKKDHIGKASQCGAKLSNSGCQARQQAVILNAGSTMMDQPCPALP